MEEPSRASPSPIPAAPQTSEITIEDPARLLRVTGMLRELRAEVGLVPLDDDGRARLAQIHEQILEELRALVSGALRDEIESFSLDLDGVPSESEVRLAQAQLAGWLQGLFAGLNAAMLTRQLQGAPGQDQHASPSRDDRGPDGQYL